MVLSKMIKSGAKPEVLRPDLGFSMHFWVSAFAYAFLQPIHIYLRVFSFVNVSLATAMHSALRV